MCLFPYRTLIHNNIDDDNNEDDDGDDIIIKNSILVRKMGKEHAIHISVKFKHRQ